MYKTLNQGLITLEGQIRRIAGLIDELKGEDIVVLDLRDICDFTDVFIIATSRSTTHMRAIVSKTRDSLKKSGLCPLNDSDETFGLWALVDCGNFIIHVLNTEARVHYNLEDLWGDAKRLEWDNISAPATKGKEVDWTA